MTTQQPYLYFDVNTLVDILGATNYPRCPEVRFTEGINLHKYIEESYRGHILPCNKETQHMLRLEEQRAQTSLQVSEEDVNGLVQRLKNITVAEQPPYNVGVVMQLVTRFLPYSVLFRRCISVTPNECSSSVISGVSDYKGGMVDLSNPFTTLPCRVLENDFLAKAQDFLRLNFNPYPNPMEDIKASITGTTPFLTASWAIQPFDPETSYIENLYRQAAGQHKPFDQCLHVDGTLLKFGFKEYVRHKIPMKRVSNGAYVCYVDPHSKTYYYTTLVFDPFCFKVLKNLLIYEIISGKAAYIHSALRFYLSMCTCEEDFRLMIEYGVIEWDFPMEGYDAFCEKVKELLGIMYCWKFANTKAWHTELVKIARWKDAKGDTSKWEDFVLTCYSGGILKTELTSTIFKSLCE